MHYVNMLYMERVEGPDGRPQVAHRFGAMSVEAAMDRNRWGLRLTSPAVTTLVGLLLAHSGEEPLDRQQIKRQAKFSDATTARSVGLLSGIGAVNEWVRTAPGGRTVLTVEPTERLASLASELPEWQRAVEDRILENDLLAVASDMGVGRNEALRLLIGMYRQVSEQ
jgi:hypothetical protein